MSARSCSQRPHARIFPAGLALALLLAAGAAPASAQSPSCPPLDGARIMEEEGIHWYRLTGIKGSAMVNINLLPAQPLGDGDFVRWSGPDYDTHAYANVRADLVEGGRVVISAELPAGPGRTSQIIAVLIGLVAPGAAGFMDYTDDACVISDGKLTDGELMAACADLRSAFRAYVGAWRRAISPDALMAQDTCGITIRNAE